MNVLATTDEKMMKHLQQQTRSKKMFLLILDKKELEKNQDLGFFLNNPPTLPMRVPSEAM